jgi:streptogramin lyase
MFLGLLMMSVLFIQACGNSSAPSNPAGGGGSGSNTATPTPLVPTFTPTPSGPTATPTPTSTPGYNLVPVTIVSNPSFNPHGIGYDGGNLWTTNGVFNIGPYSLDEYSTSGVLQNSLTTYNGTTSFNSPVGVNIGPDGTIYVGDYSGGLGLVFSSLGTLQTTIPGLSGVMNMATNSAGTTLYALLQTPNVYRYTINNGIIPRTFTYVGAFSLPLFLTPGYLTLPQALVLDASDNVYISDPGYGCITKFGPTGASPVTFGTSSLTEPYGMVFDSKGNLFVTQNANPGFIQEFMPSGGVYSAGISFGNSTLNDPYGIAVDGSDDLFVANQGGHQILEFKYSN